MVSDRAGGQANEPVVLVVDDDVKNHAAIASMVEDLPVLCTYVRSGEEALSQLLEREFAVILLDVKMPAMDGFETAKLIRARPRTRHVPIIFMTAYGPDDRQARHGYELGAVDYLFKPIFPEALRAKLKVFAELNRRIHKIRAQGEQLRTMERAAHQRELVQQRQTWEAQVLRQNVKRQRRVTQELEDLDARKDEFLAVLAHELRNPLAALVNNLVLLEGKSRDDEPLSNLHAAMDRQVGLLTRLVDDLLDVSRISQGKVALQVERLDLDELLVQAIETCRPQLETQQHQIEFVQSVKPLTIDVDRARFVQMVANLISNSARHTPRGGEIRVDWTREGERVRVFVTDTGRGIEAELLTRIFDRYVQGSDEKHRGLGLGLALVRQLAELHEGTVEARSDGPGQGSTFIIELPIRSDRVGLSSQPPAPQDDDVAAQVEARALRVVLIEDDEDIRVALKSILSGWGHDVEASPDGQSGVRMVADSCPDIVFLDIGLPDIDGYAVARQLRQALGSKTPHLVAMSGYGDQRALKLAKEAGIDRHLLKPARPDMIKRVLAEVGASLCT